MSDNNKNKIKRPLRRDFMLIFAVLLIGMVGGVLLFNNILLEKYYINDTVNFCRINGTKIKFNEDNIARK